MAAQKGRNRVIYPWGQSSNHLEQRRLLFPNTQTTNTFESDGHVPVPRGHHQGPLILQPIVQYVFHMHNKSPTGISQRSDHHPNFIGRMVVKPYENPPHNVVSPRLSQNLVKNQKSVSQLPAPSENEDKDVTTMRSSVSIGKNNSTGAKKNNNNNNNNGITLGVNAANRNSSVNIQPSVTLAHLNKFISGATSNHRVRVVKKRNRDLMKTDSKSGSNKIISGSQTPVTQTKSNSGLKPKSIVPDEENSPSE